MSPLRLFGSLVAGRLSSRRICGQAFGSASLLHQSRTLASGVGGSGFPGRLSMGESHRSVLTVGALSLLGGGILYLQDDPEEPAARKLIHQEVLEEDTVEEIAMKKRFEEWMIEYGRRYRDKEEKAMRYELFKRTAQLVDEDNARPGRLSTTATNDFADMTHEEFSCYCGGPPYIPDKELVRRGIKS
ncbi:hypothetical protein ACQ4PT_030412 [Festuca glaucescens]